MIELAMLLVWIVAIGLSALFSGAETGFYLLSRVRLELELGRGQKAAVRLERLLRRPRVVLAVVLIGNNLALQVVTLCQQWLLTVRSGLSPQASATVGAVLMTPVLFLLAEALPKNAFLARPNQLMARFSGIYQVLFRFLWPMGRLLAAVSAKVERQVPGTSQEEGQESGETEMGLALGHGLREGLLSRTEHMLAASILRFGSLTAADVSLPLDVVPHLDSVDGTRHWGNTLGSSQDSRALVFLPNTREVLGMVHAIDLALLVADGKQDVDSVLRPIPTVRGDLPAIELIRLLHRENVQLALIAPRRGRPQRLVRLKDVVRAVVGHLKGR